MEKDYRQEIESKKAQIEVIQARLAKIRTEFAAGIVPFAKKWILAIARQYIQRNPERALNLGREGLAGLKARVGRLVGEVGRFCQEVFSSGEFWPETRDLSAQNQLGICIVLGKLGPILEESGFVKGKAQTELDQESWSQYDSAGDRREFDGTPVYPHAVELPEELKVLLDEYQSSIRRKDILLGEIRSLERENLQHQATHLWDSI